MSTVHHLLTWILAVLLIPVVLSGGTVKVEYRSFEYAGCSAHFTECQMKITNFKLLIDGVVSESQSEIGLPAGNPVTLLNNANVPSLKDPFIKEFSDAKGAVGTYFEIYDITSGSQLIDNVTENIGLHQYDMSTTVNWQVKARKRFSSSGYESEFSYWVEITKCGDNFTGPGCGDCKDHYYTDKCDVYCKPVANQYNCNGQGIRECLGNFGPAGDCEKCNKGWTGTNCDTCDIGWAGDKCDTCDTNCYPEGDCSVLCIPTVMFNCNNQGERVCEPHVKGDKCDSCEKEWDIGTNCTDCAENYYPASVCNVQCIPEARFSCLDTGEKNCSENYYPAGVCDILCVLTPGMSTCDDQGKLICATNRIGLNCDICAEAWTGEKCDSCADNFYPAGDCTVYCLSDDNFACTAQGVRLCTIGSTAEECVYHNNLVGAAILGGMISGLTVVLLAGLVAIIVVTIKRRRDTAAEPIVHQGPTTQQEPDYVEMDNYRNTPIIPEPGIYND
eukprot:sb/3464061/